MTRPRRWWPSICAGSCRVRAGWNAWKLAKAAGRVLAQPVRADEDQPPFTRSTRDGFACRAAELAAMAPLRVEGMTRAGEAPAGDLPRGRSVGDHDRRAGSGGRRCSGDAGACGAERRRDPLARAGAVSARRTTSFGAGRAGAAWRGTAARRERDSERLRSQWLPLADMSTLEVYARPRVAILTTGDELVRD